MPRYYLLIAVFLGNAFVHADDAFTPAKQGMVVEIAACKIDWWPWTDLVAIRCDYRIDEGEWKHAQSGKSLENPDMMLPGTSVHLAVIDGWFYAQHEEDVRELRWIE